MRRSSINRRLGGNRTRGLIPGRVFVLLLLVSLIPGPLAQRRPALLNASSERFGGRLVLIAGDAAPLSLQQPQLLARVADYELIAPPVRVLGNPVETAAWVRQYDFTSVEGVLLSLDTIPTDAETIHHISTGGQGAPVYGFTSDPERVPRALELTAAGELDFLLIAGAGINALALGKEIAARGLTDRVMIDDGGNSAAMMLLARMLNRRFGFSPRIVPIFPSAAPGAANKVEAENRRIGAKIKTIDGWDLPQAGGPSLAIEAALFVHPPGLTEAQRLAYVESIAQVGEKGVRVGVVDLSSDLSNKEALIAALRARKLFDKLITFSSSFDGAFNDAPAGSGDAVNAALSQISTGLLGFRFLRDDLARVRRIDNAQTELLFYRFLSDWAYPVRVRPALDVYVRDEMKSDPDAMRDPEAAANVVKERLQPIADEIFKEQFHRNVHGILLSGGSRAIFEISLFQRFQARFTSPKTSNPEFLISIHSPQVSSAESPNQPVSAEWSLTQNQFDERVQARIASIDWNNFKTDALAVELSLKTAPQTGAAESYRIVASRKRKNLKIEITASTAQGAFYALGKLELLGATGGLTQDFQIAESPAFARRAVMESSDGPAWRPRDRLEMMKFLGRFRINRYVYAPRTDPFRSERWRDDYPDRDLERIKQLAAAATENFVDVVYSIEPGPSLVFSNEAELAALLRKINRLSSTGVRRFLIDFESLPPGLQNEQDREKFKTLAAAEANFLTRVYDKLKATGAGLELSVLPTAQPGAAYLKDLAAAIPADVQLLWKCAEEDSRNLTDARVKEWSAAAGRKPMILDQYPANDPFKGRLALGPKRGASPGLNLESSGFASVAGGGPRLSMLSLATAAQYTWDPPKYDPARALDAAITLLYDQRAQAALRSWVSAVEDANLFEPLYGAAKAEIALAPRESKLDELQKSLESLIATRDQGLLRGDLAQILRSARTRIAQIKSDPAFEKLPNGDYKVRK